MGAPEDEFDPERDRIYGVLKSGELVSEEALVVRTTAIIGKQSGDDILLRASLPLAHKLWPWWEAKQRK